MFEHSEHQRLNYESKNLVHLLKLVHLLEASGLALPFSLTKEGLCRGCWHRSLEGAQPQSLLLSPSVSSTCAMETLPL